MARLQEVYKQSVVPKLRERFGYQNVMQVPKITKITVNMGVGEAMADKKIIENAASDLAKISGQKPKITRARKSIATFKVRENWPIGCVVTLRGARMYEFLDRLISVALPRVRDFRRKSISTKSTRSVAWTSPSSRPPRTTRKRGRCWKRSVSRCAAEEPIAWRRRA
jgi:ribosomal protein L5